MSDLSSFIRELKRRKVFRVAAVYAVVAWLVIQVAATTFPHLGLPGWMITAVIALAVLGFPVALVLAWALEITPDGVQRTDAAVDRSTPPARLTRSENRWLTAGVVLGFLIALVGLGTYGWMEANDESAAVSTGAESVAPGAVAVLPFSYHGSPEHEYLAEGIIDLLGTKLDGVGTLRSIDPHALLSVLRQRTGGKAPDLEEAEVIAHQVGAAQFILGSVTEVGGRIQLRATLYNAQGEPSATAQVEPTPEADLFQAVDQLARELLAHELQASGDPLPSLAARTTSSISALKDYLRGEQLLRQGQAGAATERFEAAIGQDSAFALAYYGLDVANAWSHSALSGETVGRLLALSERLPEQEQMLLRAYHAYRTGEHRTAERLYRRILSRAPENVAAWYGIGELLFHYAPLSGRTPSASREPFERALAFAPEHFYSLFHLANVAAFEGERAELETLTRRMLELDPSREWHVTARTLPEFLYGDSAEFERARTDLGALGNTFFIWAGAAQGIALAFDGDLGRAKRLAALGLDPIYPPQEQARFQRVIADFELADGRRSAAKEWLDQAQETSPGEALVSEAHMAVSPFLSMPEAELHRIRERVQAARAQVGGPTANGEIPGTWTYHHLLGLLSARLGEEETALGHAESLAALPEEPSLGSLQRDLTTSIRAYTDYVQDRPERALAALESMPLEIPLNAFMLSRIGSIASARFIRAELLHALGRSEDALRAYEAAMHGNLHTVYYAAPAHLRMAQIHDARGEHAKAARHYARFVRLWQRADPELQPRVEEARQRLSQLTRAR